MVSSSFSSKLAHVGTSIFTEMSVLANKERAINLSQGFPEFDCPEFLKQATIEAINSGYNQYAPSIGIPQLLSEISKLIQRRYLREVDANECITVTSGATEALWVAIQTIVRAGDEVIVFDPAYDSYEPSVELCGGRCVHIPLRSPDYRIDWSEVADRINPNTRAIIINSPHNPTGTLLSASDLESLEELAENNDLYVISDEVYEHITFDHNTHQSVLRRSKLAKRSFVVSSFGKSFHITGWKVGYCVAPVELSREFRKIHQYVTFSTNTPAQIAIAKMLAKQPQHIDELSTFYQVKRDRLVNKLSQSKFNCLDCEGTYFLLVDYSEISSLNDREFCHWLTKNIGVAAIPLSPFCLEANKDKIIRLCFAKEDSTLDQAGELLCQL